MADQEGLDAVPPPDPVDAAAEFDRRSVAMIGALKGRVLFTRGRVTSFGILGTGMGFIVGAISVILGPTLIGLAVTVMFGAALIVNIAVLRRRLHLGLRARKPSPPPE